MQHLELVQNPHFVSGVIFALGLFTGVEFDGLDPVAEESTLMVTDLKVCFAILDSRLKTKEEKIKLLVNHYFLS